MQATTIEGQNNALTVLQRCVFCKFQVIEGQKRHDQFMREIRSEHALIKRWSHSCCHLRKKINAWGRGVQH